MLGDWFVGKNSGDAGWRSRLAIGVPGGLRFKVFCELTVRRSMKKGLLYRKRKKSGQEGFSGDQDLVGRLGLRFEEILWEELEGLRENTELNVLLSLGKKKERERSSSED